MRCAKGAANAGANAELPPFITTACLNPEIRYPAQVQVANSGFGATELLTSGLGVLINLAFFKPWELILHPNAGGHSGFGDTELLSSGLGVLINLAEGTAGLRARLAAAPVAPPFGDSASAAAGGVGVVECFGGGGGAPPATLVSLLCGLMSRMAQ